MVETFIPLFTTIIMAIINFLMKIYYYFRIKVDFIVTMATISQINLLAITVVKAETSF